MKVKRIHSHGNNMSTYIIQIDFQCIFSCLHNRHELDFNTVRSCFCNLNLSIARKNLL